MKNKQAQTGNTPKPNLYTKKYLIENGNLDLLKKDLLLRWPDVQRMTGISRTTAWRLEKHGQFPNRVRVSAGITAWRESEIQTFIKTRQAIQGAK